MLCSQEALRRGWTAAPTAGSCQVAIVSSVAAVTGSPGEYVPARRRQGGSRGVGRGLAREVAADGIRVNAVAPRHGAYGIHAARRRWGAGPARIAPRDPARSAGSARLRRSRRRSWVLPMPPPTGGGCSPSRAGCRMNGAASRNARRQARATPIAASGALIPPLSRPRPTARPTTSTAAAGASAAPTARVARAETLLDALEGGAGCLLFASGMAAATSCS